MSRTLLTLMFFLMNLTITYGQVQSTEDFISKWLKKQSSEDTVVSFRVYSLLTTFDYPFKNQSLKLDEGVYVIQEIKSHSIPYLMIVTKMQKINFVENYEVKNLLDIYWEKEKKIKSDKQKLTFLENLANFIYQRDILFKNLSN